MKDQLIKAWRIHNSKNMLLLQHMDNAALTVRLGSKGRTVGEQLVHMHNTRITWTEFVAKNLYDKSLLIGKDVLPTIEQLRTAFNASAGKLEEVIHLSWEKEGKLPSFQSGLIPFISYLVSHESHHRGNILLTLKQNNIKFPDALKWGLWEWNKPA